MHRLEDRSYDVENKLSAKFASKEEISQSIADAHIALSDAIKARGLLALQNAIAGSAWFILHLILQLGWWLILDAFTAPFHISFASLHCILLTLDLQNTPSKKHLTHL
jgi:hypothetical protein